eukprot:COSAG05_NODE_330_length_11274_cov_4.167696_5_plen_51_part_00
MLSSSGQPTSRLARCHESRRRYYLELHTDTGTGTGTIYACIPVPVPVPVP